MTAWEAMATRLRARRAEGVVGVNLGANKDSPERASDYVSLIRGLHGLADFMTVNVSSPNTPGLRGLQDSEALDALLGACVEAAKGAPLALKVAPDLDEAGLDACASLALSHSLDAIIATNTTISRGGLRSAEASQAGGLSGAPLFGRSTEALRRLRSVVGGRVALIGVGGVGDAEQAYAKIKAGASAVQLYTALSFKGLSLASRIARDLDGLLARDGFASVADAVGAEA